MQFKIVDPEMLDRITIATVEADGVENAIAAVPPGVPLSSRVRVIDCTHAHDVLVVGPGEVPPVIQRMAAIEPPPAPEEPLSDPDANLP